MSYSLQPHNCSTPGFPVFHYLLELAQIYVHWVGNTIQQFHPLSSSSLPTFNLSQHQGLFKWVSSSHQVTEVLEFPLQHQCFQWIFRTDFLQDGLIGSPCSPGDSQESSPTPLFKSINSLALSFLYSPTLTIESIGLQKVGHDWSDLACNTEQSLPVQRESQPYYPTFRKLLGNRKMFASILHQSLYLHMWHIT